jgi:hypothetical protein
LRWRLGFRVLWIECRSVHAEGADEQAHRRYNPAPVHQSFSQRELDSCKLLRFVLEIKQTGGVFKKTDGQLDGAAFPHKE